MSDSIVLDENATGALRMIASNATKASYFSNVNLERLKEMYVIWRNRKSVLELSSDENIPEDNKEDKLKKINFFKHAVTNNSYTDTTLLTMRKDETSPIVITDGIHRSIGIIKALIKNPNIKKKVNLRIVLFEGGKIAELEDYKLSIPLIPTLSQS